MIIPVKCFTCGKVIGNKYDYYQKEVRRRKATLDMNEMDVVYLTPDNVKKTPEGLVLDDLGLTKLCCRRHMMTHVDIE